MRKRFSTPTPQPPADAEGTGPFIAPDETTHRYFGNALADIRSAIAQARGDAPAPESSVEVAVEAVRSWSAELPPMAGTDTPGLTEVTQRYADQSVSGIRAAIAAAREAGSQDPETRAAARFALGETPAVKVPSLVLEARPEPAAQPPDAPAPDDEAETP